MIDLAVNIPTEKRKSPSDFVEKSVNNIEKMPNNCVENLEEKIMSLPTKKIRGAGSDNFSGKYDELKGVIYLLNEDGTLRKKKDGSFIKVTARTNGSQKKDDTENKKNSKNYTGVSERNNEKPTKRKEISSVSSVSDKAEDSMTAACGSFLSGDDDQSSYHHPVAPSKSLALKKQLEKNKRGSQSIPKETGSTQNYSLSKKNVLAFLIILLAVGFFSGFIFSKVKGPSLSVSQKTQNQLTSPASASAAGSQNTAAKKTVELIQAVRDIPANTVISAAMIRKVEVSAENYEKMKEQIGSDIDTWDFSGAIVGLSSPKMIYANHYFTELDFKNATAGK